MSTDQSFMKMALDLARRGLGQVWPNPTVGCVLTRDGRVIGRGRTALGGRPHAETEALKNCDARGATAYVTLEPCAHTGKTGPCCDALIAAGVARVVVALRDPDPRVDGGGIARLRDAGVAVTVGVLEDEARELNQGFLSRVTQGRPMLTLKLATSFDGRIATATGESRWITGPEARRYVHGMRARHDAVMVGGGTARADDPSLTVRGFGEIPQPVRVVLSRSLDVPKDGVLAQTAGQVPLWICHGDGVDPAKVAAWADLGARLIEVPVAPGGRLDPEGVLQALGAAGLTRVFCEGGGALTASLVAADMVDVLVGFTAGVTLGAEGWPSLGAMGIERLSEAARFELTQVADCGGDVLHIWRRKDAP